jgi:uncharacterized membrane protein
MIVLVSAYAPAAMGKERVEAFSDGVIAIAITLLVLDIHVPEPRAGLSLADRLGAQWPSYAAYAISFLTIGIIWINHHAMLRRLAGVDHSILLLNLVVLLTVAILPFSTALMAAYLKSGAGEKLAAAIYGGSFLLMSIAFFAMQQHILRAKPHLLPETLTPEVKRSVLWRNFAGLLPYVVATAGAAITPYLTFGLCAAVALYYALPATTAPGT